MAKIRRTGDAREVDDPERRFSDVLIVVPIVNDGVDLRWQRHLREGIVDVLRSWGKSPEDFSFFRYITVDSDQLRFALTRHETELLADIVEAIDFGISRANEKSEASADSEEHG